jgi:uncharacterized coiled-coil protein SlyX
MAWESEDRRVSENPGRRLEVDYCASHVHNEQSIAELKTIVSKLNDGMGQVREGMIQLTEAFKALGKVDARLDKLEEIHNRDSERNRERLERLESNVYKAGALIAAILLVIELGFRLWGVK